MTSLNVSIVDDIFKELQQTHSEYDVLIESGTLGGETIMNLQPYFRTLHTIELSQYYYEYFDQVKKEKQYKNVINHFGDTTQVLPKILETLSSRNKVIFWLDGHYSSYDTAKGEKDCPLIEECLSIDGLYKSNKGLILIDDYRLFGTNDAEDWSDITVENIIKCFTKHSVKCFVKNDIFVLYIEK
jgi:hypothetical protein